MQNVTEPRRNRKKWAEGENLPLMKILRKVNSRWLKAKIAFTLPIRISFHFFLSLFRNFGAISVENISSHCPSRDLFSTKQVQRPSNPINLDLLVLNKLFTFQEKKHLGELMVSLCYLPRAGRLTLTVIKARNLRAGDKINGKSGECRFY